MQWSNIGFAVSQNNNSNVQQASPTITLDQNTKDKLLNAIKTGNPDVLGAADRERIVAAKKSGGLDKETITKLTEAFKSGKLQSLSGKKKDLGDVACGWCCFCTFGSSSDCGCDC